MFLVLVCDMLSAERHDRSIAHKRVSVGKRILNLVQTVMVSRCIQVVMMSWISMAGACRQN